METTALPATSSDLNHHDDAALPVAVIGAGPIGLATAAHLLERGVAVVVLEAGPAVGATVSQWGHTKTFSTWQYNIDAAARRLLDSAGWEAPNPKRLPTGADLVEQYLAPLAATGPIADILHLNHRVTGVSRAGADGRGLDKTHSRGRDASPFLVRIAATTPEPRGNAAGPGAGVVVKNLYARAVVDASGTWEQPNPVGPAGLQATGEREARAAGLITSALPDVLGADRERFAGRHTLVVGAGHSAANTLLLLGRLADQQPGTRVTWALRSADPERVYGGGDKDGLPARGALGMRLKNMVETGRIELRTSFSVAETEPAGGRLTVRGRTPAGGAELTVDALVPATGFRPDLDVLRELRLELDPAVEAPRELGPLIDPEFHSCGTVEPHGARLLAHPEKDFYIVGMKSYGRAPTFLMATGYEQVRSIAAALAGDPASADRLELELPETGVCSAGAGSNCDVPAPAAEATDGGGADSCCTAPEPALIGIPTGLAHGRQGPA
ncbi:FAD-dependent oxidoreductase [Zhihengliuella salsuginis]|uniref:FAD-dependent oxidoreductase n=1 Tax=Zhihengliuella salsuginis TaxID=578222 RepID=UPI001E613AB8|nr:FAD-dependent oxidoreductase [Zhihengliuella salsuginis]